MDFKRVKYSLFVGFFIVSFYGSWAIECPEVNPGEPVFLPGQSDCLTSKDPIVCFNAGIFLYQRGEVEDARAAWAISCDNGHGCLKACDNLAVTTEDIVESIVRYGQACQEGSREGLPKSCTGLGTLEYKAASAFIEGGHMDDSLDMFAKSKKHSEDGCNGGRGDIDGCILRGRIALDFESEERSLKWFGFGCTEVEGRACAFLGVTLHKLDRSEEALEHLARACGNSGGKVDDFACYYLRLVSARLGTLSI